MNLKKKLRKFFALSPRANAGFTLVELIVVIAILAILAGIGVPAYSGYVEKANMQADITLVSEVEQALLLQYYAAPQQAMTSSVVLSESGATAEGDTFATAAMQAAFGDSWKSNKLKHDSWGNGAAVTQDVINYFKTVGEDSPLYDIFNGNADISYTDNIPELFDLLEDTAISIAGKRDSLGSGANMVTNAATITNTMTIPGSYEGTAATPAEYFSELWASKAWDSNYLMQGSGSDYNGNAGQLTDDKLNNAIANAGVIKARNVALANYLKDQGYPEAYDAIANYTYKDGSGKATAVPDDAAGAILDGDGQKLGLDTLPEATQEAVAGAIYNYYGMDPSTGAIANPTASQAYTDGLAYYAMMSTVDSLKDSENLDNTNDATYWNDLSSAVDMYSAVANGEASLSDLSNLYTNIGTVSGNTVVVMLIVQNGVPNVMISPVAANP